MAYLFRGRLCGLICSECPEPLSGVTIRLYRSRAEQNVTALAIADPKDTVHVLSVADAAAKAASLLGEVVADADGNFAIAIDEKQRYGGEAFEIDLYFGT